MKLKKLVGDKNKQIMQYFDTEEIAVKWIEKHIANPKAFQLHELKGIVSDVLTQEGVSLEVTETATEMLKSIGYGIVKTDSLGHLKSLDFESWFEPQQAWCKYRDEARWSAYDIFIIYKLDGQDIKPLADPKVGDEYSLSLMSVGCSEGHMFQICQRYNHRAKGSADWALGGNLDNLLRGLTQAFCAEFGYNSLGATACYMPERTIVRHGKYIKYNYEINDIYFYADGIITSEEFLYTDKSRYTIVDYLVVDWVDKVVIDPANTKDGLIEPLWDSLKKGTLEITKI